MSKMDIEKIRKDSAKQFEKLGLKPRTTYHVRVALRKGNLVHNAILTTKFNPNDQVEIYNDTYDGPIRYYLSMLETIEIIQTLYGGLLHDKS